MLALRDKRRLGRARLEPDLDLVGPDAAEIPRAEFRARIGRGTAPLKARLMDQGVIAGVGNLLADETLWRAYLSPRREAGSLSEEELDRLRRELRAATRAAIRKGGVHTGAFIAHRERGGVCPRCGTPLERATVGGRTTYWCPAEQVYRYGRTNVSGSGPMRSPASSASMRPISSSVRWKSKRSKFSSMRSGVTDLGNTTLPSWTCQRSTT